MRYIKINELYINNMGRLRVDYIDNVSLDCKNCSIQLIDIDDIICKSIETAHGDSVIIKKMINYQISNTDKFRTSSMNMYETFITFDDDCPFETSETGICRDIYCRQCNLHLGHQHFANGAKISRPNVFICYKAILS